MDDGEEVAGVYSRDAGVRIAAHRCDVSPVSKPPVMLACRMDKCRGSLLLGRLFVCEGIEGCRNCNRSQCVQSNTRGTYQSYLLYTTEYMPLSCFKLPDDDMTITLGLLMLHIRCRAHYQEYSFGNEDVSD